LKLPLLGRAPAWLPPPRFFLVLLAGLAACIPLWVVKYLPMQDLPVHFATLRILSNLNDPAWGLSDYASNMSETQYLSLYAVGIVLGKIIGVKASLLVLVSAMLIGIVLTTYALAERLSGDGRVALLTIPLLYNSMMMLGFVQFIFGIPVMLGMWLAALAYRDKRDVRSGIVLGALELVLFFSHLFPFAIGQLGLLAIVRPRTWTEIRKLAVYLVPTGLAFLYWALLTAGARAVESALSTTGVKMPFSEAVRDFYSVGFDVFHDSTDERHVLIAVAIAVVVWLGGASSPEATRPIRRWMGLVPFVCLVLFFLSQDNNGYIYYIRQRYPVLFAMAAVPLVRFPTGWKGHLATLAMCVLAGSTIESVTWHFRMFERYELGDIDGALNALPNGKRVLGLMFSSASAYIQNWPFVHFVNYCQLEHGGTVYVTFAGQPHWPVRYREHHAVDGLDTSYGQEWEPDRVSNDPYLAEKFDYVLVRGPGFDPPERLFRKVFAGDRWTLWQPLPRWRETP
jgi:hypothetical protein